MKTSLLAMFCGFLFVFAGCAETRITGFRDPVFREAVFEDVVVMAQLGNLTDNKMAEDYFVQCLSRKKVRARAFLDLFPPTREVGQSEALQKLKEEGVGALLTISIKDRREATWFTKGTSHTVPQETDAVQLIEVKSGAIVWTAEAFSDGTEAAGGKEILSSLAAKTTAVLLEEGLVRRSPAPHP